jgi:glycine cleavage system aminomethyltransferase T
MYVTFYTDGKKVVLGPYYEVMASPQSIEVRKSNNETFVTIGMFSPASGDSYAWTIVADNGSLIRVPSAYITQVAP